jgi:hypothetical protein
MAQPAASLEGNAGTLDGETMTKADIPDRLSRTSDVNIDFAVEPQPVFPMTLSMHRMVEAVRRSTEERRWIKFEEIR